MESSTQDLKFRSNFGDDNSRDKPQKYFIVVEEITSKGTENLLFLVEEKPLSNQLEAKNKIPSNRKRKIISITKLFIPLQMQRIRDYSNGQLERVNENYIFQRQKLRKFSSQNFLKMRETKKYTQKTLNKVMENLPALYLDLTACRQGLRDRQPSLEWEEDEFQVRTN